MDEAGSNTYVYDCLLLYLPRKRLLMQMDTFKGTQTAGVHAP